MFEILVVRYLSKRIRGIVEPKGYKASTWQTYAVLLWFGVEIGVLFISLMFFTSSTPIAVLNGYLCAIGVAIFLQAKAKKLPDLNEKKDEWLENLGNQDYN